MKNKKGISLVVLTITIIVIVILASTVIFYLNDTMVSSQISAFALDLKNVEDLVYDYYLNNNELPIDDTVTSYDKDTLISLITDGKNELSTEIADNKDDDETFYIVDLTKLSVESTSKGLQVNDDIADSYIVTKDSMNIYYLKGEKIRDKYYFSLSDEIVKKSELDIDKTIDNSSIYIPYTTSTIDFEKSTKDWTNTLTVEIKTEVGSGETLTYTLAGVDITSSVTTNIVNVSQIVSSNEEIKNAFYSSNSNKILKVQKNKDGAVVASANVDVSNLDILSGNVVNQSNVKHTKYDNYILSNVSGYIDLGGSNLKEIRVLYTAKLDESGKSVAYYENLPQTITKEYIYSVGKRNEGLLIKLPVDVTGYSLVFVDNAGNISDINTYTVSY